MDNNIAKEVAKNLGSVVANQSLEVAALKTENDDLKAKNSELQEIINKLRKKRNNESSANTIANKQKH